MTTKRKIMDEQRKIKYPGTVAEIMNRYREGVINEMIGIIYCHVGHACTESIEQCLVQRLIKSRDEVL